MEDVGPTLYKCYAKVLCVLKTNTVYAGSICPFVFLSTVQPVYMGFIYI